MTIAISELTRDIHISGLTVCVKYPKNRWIKNAAWRNLLKNPPEELLPYLEKLNELFPNTMMMRNPWRAAHTSSHLVWNMKRKTEEELQSLIEEANSEETRQFDPKVWKSTSNKYRSVSRLPEGLTAVEALQKYSPETYQRLLRQLENGAQAEWMRCFAPRVDGCSETLTEAEWIAFRKAGGTSA